jgi:MoaA/NifB/PqqE/SkfB family radical SAM enzyme
VTTNGTTLCGKVLQALLSPGLDTLDVSFHGLDKETYERNMHGADYARALEAVADALRIIRRSGAATKLQINYMVSRENSDEEERIQAFWRARGVEHFRPQRLHDRAGLADTCGMTATDRAGLNGRPCEIFQAVTFVTWQGDVLYCCHDIPRRHKIGNFKRDSWETIQARKKEIITSEAWPAMCRACRDPLRHDMSENLDLAVHREIRRRAFVGVENSVRRLGAFFGRSARTFSRK